MSNVPPLLPYLTLSVPHIYITLIKFQVNPKNESAHF